MRAREKERVDRDDVENFARSAQIADYEDALARIRYARADAMIAEKRRREGGAA